MSKNKNIFEEIVVCPRPLVLRRKSGQIFARAKLATGSCVWTSYCIDCSGIGKKETFKFTSRSAHENLQQMLVGPVSMNYVPAVSGLLGGVGKVELRLEDGSVHEFKFPWGTEIFQYLNGKK